MKRRILIISGLLIFMFGLSNFTKTHAQIFLLEEDHESARMDGYDFEVPNVMPLHDSALDFTPIGDGIWLLGCLGGAYLLKRRKKGDE